MLQTILRSAAQTMTAKQNMGHGSIYGVESEVFTFKDEIR